jgi:ABC-2 type transport system permease protein
VIGPFRAELLKQRSTQTMIALFSAMFGLVALAIALHVLTPAVSELATRADQLSTFEAGTRIGMLFAGLSGALAITAEYRYGTIRPTFLVTPTRWPVIVAKLAVSGSVGLVFGLVAGGLMAGAAGAGLAARGIDIQLTSDDYVRLLVGGMAAAALWAIVGLGVGAVVRNQIATVVGLCTWRCWSNTSFHPTPRSTRRARGPEPTAQRHRSSSREPRGGGSGHAVRQLGRRLADRAQPRTSWLAVVSSMKTKASNAARSEGTVIV